MSRTMHLTLRAGERVYINGAVLCVDRKVSLELLNDATFLLEGHVLQAENATTPLRQLYFAAQTMLIEPAQAGSARELYRSLDAGLRAATASNTIRDGLEASRALIEGGRYFEALKLIRGLYPVEEGLLAEPVRPLAHARRASRSAPLPHPIKRPAPAPALATKA